MWHYSLISVVAIEAGHVRRITCMAIQAQAVPGCWRVEKMESGDTSYMLLMPTWERNALRLGCASTSFCGTHVTTCRHIQNRTEGSKTAP